MTDVAANRAHIKAHFIAERGYWRPWTEALLQADPVFLARYASYAGYPARSGPLSERMVELIYVALDASAAHLFTPGLKTHMTRALEVGASEADIFDVLHLLAAQGLESVYQSAAILAEEAADDPLAVPDAVLQARIEQHCAELGEVLMPIAQRDSGYAHVLLDFLAHRGSNTGLTPRERGLVQVALHACFTAFNPGAVRRLIRATLAEGATSAELMQAIQLGAHLSVHGTALGATVFAEIQPC
jgi:alkylhydroperoxidase/carboxymuconolactone decarboxylase family protein YurZ